MSDLSPNLIPAETPAPKYLSGLRTVLRDVMSRPSGAIGLSLVVFHVLLALTSPLYVPYDFKTMNSMLMLMPLVRTLARHGPFGPRCVDPGAIGGP